MSGSESIVCCCGGLFPCVCPSLAQIAANCPEEVQVNIEGFSITVAGSNPCNWPPTNISFPVNRVIGGCNSACVPYRKIGNSLFTNGNRELIIYGCPSGIGDAVVSSLGCGTPCSLLTNYWGFKLGCVVRQVAGNPSCNPVIGARDIRWRVPVTSSSPSCSIVCPPHEGWEFFQGTGATGSITVDY